MVGGPGTFEKKEGRREERKEGKRERKVYSMLGTEFVRNAIQILHNHLNFLCVLDFSIKVSYYGTGIVHFLSYEFFLHKFYSYVIMHIKVHEYHIFLEDYNLSKWRICPI